MSNKTNTFHISFSFNLPKCQNAAWPKGWRQNKPVPAAINSPAWLLYVVQQPHNNFSGLQCCLIKTIRRYNRSSDTTHPLQFIPLLFIVVVNSRPLDPKQHDQWLSAAKLTSLTCPHAFHKYVFILLRRENRRSASAPVAGIVSVNCNSL